MRNRRYPNYPDDTDYTTNSPSYYDDLAKKQKLIQLLTDKIWKYDDEIKEYFRRWEHNLSTINDEVIEMMIKWAEDGTLDDIINMVLMNQKVEIHVSTDEPITDFPNSYWYHDVGNSGLQTSIYKYNVAVSDDEPDDERYNV